MALLHNIPGNTEIIQNDYVLFATTTGNTITELTTDGAAGSAATNRIPIPANTASSVVVNIVAKQTGSANSKQYLRQFLITNNGGTVTIEGVVTVLGTDIGSVALAATVITITANDTNDCMKVEVTGLAATTIKWEAYVVVTDLTD